jgi:hypothetical protein
MMGREEQVSSTDRYRMQASREDAPGREEDKRASAEAEDEADVALAALDALGDPSDPPRLGHAGGNAGDTDRPAEHRSVTDRELRPAIPEADVVRAGDVPAAKGDGRTEDGVLDEHRRKVERDPVGQNLRRDGRSVNRHAQMAGCAFGVKRT